MARISGNKGEWSELYTLLYLLAHGRLNAADCNLNVLPDVFFPILNIFREETEGSKVQYHLSSEYENQVSENCADKKVVIYLNEELLGCIPQSEIQSEVSYLYNSICSESGSFSLEKTEMFMEKMHCYKLKAPTREKADIVLQIHDINTGYTPICGFSIKSDLGSPPTLLNASKTTNFVYAVNGLTKESAEKINGIDTRQKIIDRMNSICTDGGTLVYSGMHNKTFRNNLVMLDSMLPQIMSAILLYSYTTGQKDCKDIVAKIEEQDPLQYGIKGIYAYKFKKFLCAIALGMMPATSWNGYDEANGGYIIVKKDGDVVAYHIYNRNSFEDYLLDNTCFERASTKKHDYAHIYENDGKMYINLNAQIRFI